jgi:zinc transporter, ZIP family
VEILEGAFWGFVGGAALILGAVIALVHDMSRVAIGRIMAFGAGVLISALTFDLTEEAFNAGGTAPTAAGLLLGGAVFVTGDALIGRREMRERMRSGERAPEEEGNPSALALGAVLDGIPESFVIGASVTHGEGVALPVVVAVFLSNVPESLSAAAGFRRHGWTPRQSIRLWVFVTVVATASAAMGALVADDLADNWFAAVNSFAAGAVLAMIADTMIPDAFRDAGRWAGFITVAGFALAFLISSAG